MQHFNAADFTALSPAKAKSAALAMFGAAQLDGPSADWQGVAYALHSVVTRKRASKTGSDIAMQDAADAGDFAPWLDYEPKGKGTAILRGRVTVTFSDGWSRTVGVLQAKGKGWSIGKAAVFAVACYQAAAARRMVGSDSVLYSGEHFLPGLIAVPEISSIESADSDETRAGDLIWDPVAANAATRELRAGQVDPATYVRGELGEECALSRARFEIGRRMGLMKTAAEIHMMRANHEAAECAGALLFPWDRGRDPARVESCAILFAALMDTDPEGFPIPVEPGEFEIDPRADLPAADHATMLLAGEIVGPVGPDEHAEFWGGDFAHALSSVSFKERFLLVEDALLAWPALVEPCAFVDGETIEVVETVIPVSETVGPVDTDEEAAADPLRALVEADGWEIGQHGKWINHRRNDGAAYPADNPRAFRYIVEDYKLGEEEAARHEDSAPPAAGQITALERDPVPPAAPEAVAEPLPAAKPRYRFSPITGLYEIVPATER